MRLRWRWFFILMGTAFFLGDRFLKMFFLQFTGTWEFFAPWLSFSLLKNTGLAFGIPVAAGWMVVPTVLILAVVLWQLFTFVRLGRDQFWIPLFFIFLGAASNFFDRVMYGFVIDYVHVGWYPVFNLADVLIVSGVVFLLWSDLRTRRSKH